MTLVRGVLTPREWTRTRMPWAGVGLLVVVLAGGVLALPRAMGGDGCCTKQRLVERQLEHLALNAAAWRETRCPTVAELLPAKRRQVPLTPRDAWGTPFLVACDEGGPKLVTSAGRDRMLATDDDLSAAVP